MGKNRDRLGIIASILEAAELVSRKTRIMYAANLSFKLLEKYLETVVQAGFVSVSDSDYVLTERGRDFLDKYRRFKERHSKAQEAIEELSSERERLRSLCENCARS